jgi:hypothetical protein
MKLRIVPFTSGFSLDRLDALVTQLEKTVRLFSLHLNSLVTDFFFQLLVQSICCMPARLCLRSCFRTGPGRLSRVECHPAGHGLSRRRGEGRQHAQALDQQGALRYHVLLCY